MRVDVAPDGDKFVLILASTLERGLGHQLGPGRWIKL
jgi:hypothetical protein